MPRPFNLRVQPPADRSWDKATWKRADSWARTVSNILGEGWILGMQEAVDEAFKDLMLYGTSTLRISSTPDTK